MSTFSGDESARFFGFIGAAAALKFRLWIGPMKLTDLHIPLIGFDLTLAIFSMGAAYGTAKSGVGVASMGVMRPELVMQSIVPVVMAGVL
ncbi:hypothetical protein IGI04_013663, partial [Brassica rapa subsp. trilocularis]